MPFYTPTAKESQELRNWFMYHTPVNDQAERYKIIRDAARTFAETLLLCVPPSADRTAAIRKLREAVMTANAGIACNEVYSGPTTLVAGSNEEKVNLPRFIDNGTGGTSGTATLPLPVMLGSTDAGKDTP